MNNKRNKYFILLMLTATVMASCKNQWLDHNATTDTALGNNLLVQISQDPNLSLFSQYLTKTGYDKVISSSKTYTVWAPTNAAIAAAKAIDATLETDNAKLLSFVGNHISYQSYNSNVPQPSLRIKMMNGKSITFTKTTFEDANIIKADGFASNGIYHTIDKAIFPKLNIWDYVKSLTTVGQAEKAYLMNQNYPHQDTSKAKVLSIDPLTGLPIYDPNTGIDTLNHFIDQTLNLKSEDSQFTFFVLTDAALASEGLKITRFTQTGDPVTTAAAINYNVIKDLVLPGVYTPAMLPDSIISLFKVKLAINKNLIVSTYNASNGVVYVIGTDAAGNSGASFRLQDKYPPLIIQGENYTGFSNSGYTNRVVINTKIDPNGVPYTNFTLTGLYNGVLTAGSWVRYSTTLGSMPYKVYWRVINFNTLAFKQRLSFGTASAGTFPYITVPVAASTVYTEAFIGTYNSPQYGINNAFVIGDNTTNTAGANSVTLDYLKLVPVFQ